VRPRQRRSGKHKSGGEEERELLPSGLFYNEGCCSGLLCNCSSSAWNQEAA
jgi:hypothetical protein